MGLVSHLSRAGVQQDGQVEQSQSGMGEDLQDQRPKDRSVWR
jgi:hypothetical protein